MTLSPVKPLPKKPRFLLVFGGAATKLAYNRHKEKFYD